MPRTSSQQQATSQQEKESRDGKPMVIHVSRTNMSHVAEEDAEWLRKVIREAQAR